MMITKINEFKKYLINEAEDNNITTNLTSTDVKKEDNDTSRLDEYNQLLKNYKSNKDKFKSIFKKDKKDWEKTAETYYKTELDKLDNKKYNNKYLLTQWGIAKLENNLDEITNNINALSNTSGDLSKEQLTINKENIDKLQEDLRNIKNEINIRSKDLQNDIKKDLDIIKKSMY